MNQRLSGPVLGARETLGVLSKEVPFRILNCSSSGCLLETRSRLDVGTIASLRASWNGHEFSEDIQVVRCQEIAGAGSLFHIGVQFLWTAVPRAQSLRSAMQNGRGVLGIGAEDEKKAV